MLNQTPMNQAPQTPDSPGLDLALAPWRPVWVAATYQSEAMRRVYEANMLLAIEAQQKMLNATMAFWTGQAARGDDTQDLQAATQSALDANVTALQTPMTVIEELRRPAA